MDHLAEKTRESKKDKWRENEATLAIAKKKR